MSRSDEPSPIVLVPGACLGGWAWREVAATLRALGHEVYPVTLTGLGERVHLASREVDLETHIADVVNLLDYEDLSDAVLVGHSYAGVVIIGVADQRPERLRAVVYLDTGPLPGGMAIADVQTPEQRERQRREAEQGGNGWLWPVPDHDTLLSGAYGSASGLKPADFELIAARATPQPYATFTTPLRLSDAAPPGLRRAAIFCSEGGMSLALLRELIAQHDPRADVLPIPHGSSTSCRPGTGRCSPCQARSRSCSTGSPRRRAVDDVQRSSAEYSCRLRR